MPGDAAGFHMILYDPAGSPEILQDSAGFQGITGMPGDAARFHTILGDPPGSPEIP